MNFREVTMKYDSFIVFMRLDPVDIRRLIGQTPLVVPAWVGEASPVFKVFLRVVFLAPVVQIRVFLHNQAYYCTKIEYNKGAASTQSISGWGGLCEREGKTSR
jgi:hypothetical protein